MTDEVRVVSPQMKVSAAVVGVVHVVHQPTGGGAEFLVRELNRRLYAFGIESHAVYLSNPRGLPLESNESCLGLAAPRMPGTYFALKKHLKKLLRERHFSIVHAHTTWPFLYCALISYSARRDYIYTEHNTYNGRRSFAFLRHLDRQLYRRYREIICISDGARDALSGWLQSPELNARTFVIPNGARTLPLKNSFYEAGRPLRIVSIGSLSRQKGFDVAIHAIAACRGVVSSYTIVGEGGEREPLTRLVEDLGLEGVVQLVGWVDDIVPYIHDADVCVIPSRWEGFGLVAAEVLSAGIPIFASDVAGLRDVVSGAPIARLVRPDDPLAIARELTRFYESHIDCRAHSVEARHWSRRFSLDVMARGYANVYQRCAL